MMNYAKRAALASLFIFPGGGFFLLKQYVRGVLYAAPAAVVIVLLFKNLIEVTLKISEQLNQNIARGNLNIDLISLWSQLHGAFYSSPYWHNGKWILLVTWLLSGIASYYAGKKIDQQQK
jgi:hypothetical protein